MVSSQLLRNVLSLVAFIIAVVKADSALGQTQQGEADLSTLQSEGYWEFTGPDYEVWNANDPSSIPPWTEEEIIRHFGNLSSKNFQPLHQQPQAGYGDNSNNTKNNTEPSVFQNLRANYDGWWWGEPVVYQLVSPEQPRYNYPRNREVSVTYCDKSYNRGFCRSPSNIHEGRCYRLGPDFANRVPYIINNMVIKPLRTCCRWYNDEKCLGDIWETDYHPDGNFKTEHNSDGKWGRQIKSYMCVYHIPDAGRCLWPFGPDESRMEESF